MLFGTRLIEPTQLRDYFLSWQTATKLMGQRGETSEWRNSQAIESTDRRT